MDQFANIVRQYGSLLGKSTRVRTRPVEHIAGVARHRHLSQQLPTIHISWTFRSSI